MTMPAPATVKTVELPAPRFPMVTRMISNALFPASKVAEEVVTWTVSQSHPLMQDTTVVRMFIVQGGVEVYSVSSDRANGVRNFIPMTGIRLIEEAMPLDVFISELADAESGDDDDEDDEPEPEIDLTPAPTPNGQPVTS